MSDKPEPALPELPEVAEWMWDDMAYTPEQMRSYGAACFRAGMERAAEIAEEEARQFHALDGPRASAKKSGAFSVLDAIRKEAGNG